MPVSNIEQQLQQAGVRDVRKKEPMANYTTWRVGGPADWFIYPKNKDELEQTMRILYRENIPWLVIGRGSNMLVRDGGFRGAVIKLGEGLDGLSIEGTRVVAGGGYSFVRLSAVTAKAGLAGLEYGAGIPGTVGGAVFMNAGAHGSDVSKTLVSAEVLLGTGEWMTMSNEDFKFCYRTTVLQKEVRGIVTEAVFELTPGDPKAIMEKLNAYKERRYKTQPLHHRCAGSVFRNPPGDYAGRLIEAAGLKGYRIGDAEVSTLHGNFIINRGKAKAADILALISEVQTAVKDKYGVTLHPEVRVVGEG